MTNENFNKPSTLDLGVNSFISPKVLSSYSSDDTFVPGIYSVTDITDFPWLKFLQQAGPMETETMAYALLANPDETPVIVRDRVIDVAQYYMDTEERAAPTNTLPLLAEQYTSLPSSLEFLHAGKKYIPVSVATDNYDALSAASASGTASSELWDMIRTYGKEQRPYTLTDNFNSNTPLHSDKDGVSVWSEVGQFIDVTYESIPIVYDPDKGTITFEEERVGQGMIIITMIIAGVVRASTITFKLDTPVKTIYISTSKETANPHVQEFNDSLVLTATINELYSETKEMVVDTGTYGNTLESTVSCPLHILVDEGGILPFGTNKLTMGPEVLEPGITRTKELTAEKILLGSASLPINISEESIYIDYELAWK